MVLRFAVMLFLVALLTACGGGDSGSDGAGSGCSDHSCFITMTDSGGHLNSSANVGMMVFALPSCLSGSVAGSDSSYFRSGADSALLGFAFNPAFFGAGAAGITIWIDSNDSRNLDPGDWTWGNSSTIQTIFCTDSLANLEAAFPFTFNWTATGNKHAGGTRQWTGASKTYSVGLPREQDGQRMAVVAVDTLAAD